MLKNLLFTIVFVLSAFAFVQGQTAPTGTDTVLILPFENTSQRAEFNWVGESFADSLSDLLKVPSLNVVSNDERKIIQQRLRVPLTSLPSLATSLKLAREGDGNSHERRTGRGARSKTISGKQLITKKEKTWLIKQ